MLFKAALPDIYAIATLFRLEFCASGSRLVSPLEVMILSTLLSIVSGVRQKPFKKSSRIFPSLAEDASITSEQSRSSPLGSCAVTQKGNIKVASPLTSNCA